MAFEPGRNQPSYNQQGNPLGPGPNMRHPSTNPGGLLPGPMTPRTPEAWSDFQYADFRSDGTNQVWRWESPVFDLRPGVSAAYGQIPAAVPINNEGALGKAIYLSMILGEATGTLPPAAVLGLRVQYFEDGNVLRADNGSLIRLTQSVDITETVLAGGTSIVAPFGGSPVSFQPCMVGLRFWKLSVVWTIEGVVPITRPYFIEGALH